MNIKRDIIKNLVIQEGLQFIGITDITVEKHIFNTFVDWAIQYSFLDLKYLAKQITTRQSPSMLMHDAQSIIVIGLNYYCSDSLKTIRQSNHPYVAQYARFEDYHKALKSKCQNIVQNLSSLYPNLKAKICVDSSPLFEKYFASKTSSGFIGKNTLFISYNEGSFLNLAEIITNIKIHPTENNTKAERVCEFMIDCDNCNLCIKSCPFGAINDNYTINPSKCFSYWSIEAKDIIPYEMWEGFKYYYFGCDICQLVCPWNKKLSVQTSQKIKVPQEKLENLINLSKEEFKKVYKDTVILRLKYEQFLRNILIALYINKNIKIKEIAHKFLEHESSVLSNTASMILQKL